MTSPGEAPTGPGQEDDVAAYGRDDAAAEGPAEEWWLPSSRRTVLTIAVVVGLATGVLGTVVHRSQPPLGLILALTAVVSGTVLVRALAGLLGVAVAGGTLLLVTQLLSTVRRGGDIIVADDGLGYGWLLGAVVAVAVVVFLPGGWFASRPHDPGES